MADHLHSMTLINQLQTLIDRQAVIRCSDVRNDLNNLYVEGMNAHKADHFIERHNVDLTFGASCDSCAQEIEFLLFTCLGCRTFAICEDCYFKQLNEDEGEEIEKENESVISDTADEAAVKRRRLKSLKTMKEHSKKHIFLRCYDY